MIVLIAYEIFENFRYREWRLHFNGAGKFDVLTVSSSNKKLMWEYKAYGKYKNLETNRYGFRGEDYEWGNKEEKVYRVGFIGDSVTLGMGIEFDKIFTRIIEGEANKLDLPLTIQSLNFGVDGYNILQIYETLATKVLECKPDKIVYVMCLNDFDFHESSGGKIRYFKKPDSFFLEKINKLRQRLSASNYHLYHFNKNKEVAFQEILKMNKLLKGKGSLFQVVIMPIFDQTAIDFINYPLSKMHNEIDKFLLKNGIDVIDLLDYFKKQKKPPKHYAESIWHLNENGHRFAASVLLSPVMNEAYKLQKQILRAG